MRFFERDERRALKFEKQLNNLQFPNLSDNRDLSNFMLNASSSNLDKDGDEVKQYSINSH